MVKLSGVVLFSNDGGGNVVKEEVEIEVDDDITELDLTRRRLLSAANFGSLPNLEMLILRWNLLKKIENVNGLHRLTHLSLYDNQITTIENLTDLPNLCILDLSYNRITKIEGLETLKNLKELYLTRNKLSKIEGLSCVRLSTLKELEVLSFIGNAIRDIEGLGALTKLADLAVSQNGLTRIAGLTNNIALTTLDLNDNRIEKIENLQHLVNLKALWIRNNKYKESSVNGNKIFAVHNISTATEFVRFCHEYGLSTVFQRTGSAAIRGKRSQRDLKDRLFEQWFTRNVTNSTHIR
ncbi:leucine Rich repeat-containing domain protein [Ancylostoma ceylanicum]|uniref:Leucine Rich repeat-containing domain protein n=1 Tax=Ancylostoma ceylanicum TaxID=53326 RepID=A0A0D6LWZ3_9BILA|nr:leucine Rich repeat-containing domain protein [Ancylostoma ceylanicum]